LAGDAETGITIMQMEAGLDTGPSLLASKLSIGEHETAGSLHDRLATLGPPLLLRALAGLAAGTLRAIAQPATGVCYAQKIRKEEALMDWSRPAVELDRQVRAFNPWPVAETRLHGEQLRVWEAHPEADIPAAQPGSVVACAAEGVLVATGSGALRLTRLQLAGRKAMPASEFAKSRRMVSVVLGIEVAGTGKPVS
jgi:methionyl-tRNA formyltransferase